MYGERLVSPYYTFIIIPSDLCVSLSTTQLTWPSTHTHWPTKIPMQLMLGLISRKWLSIRLNFWTMLEQVSASLTPWIVLHVGTATTKFILKLDSDLLLQNLLFIYSSNLAIQILYSFVQTVKVQLLQITKIYICI